MPSETIRERYRYDIDWAFSIIFRYSSSHWELPVISQITGPLRSPDADHSLPLETSNKRGDMSRLDDPFHPPGISYRLSPRPIPETRGDAWRCAACCLMNESVLKEGSRLLLNTWGGWRRGSRPITTGWLGIFHRGTSPPAGQGRLGREAGGMEGSYLLGDLDLGRVLERSRRRLA